MGDTMSDKEKDDVIYLYLDDIIPNRFQPREVFDERALNELAVSIKEHGVIQPIIVRSVNDKYEIIAGERRYKAAAMAGLTKIPAIIRDLDDKESSKVALLENLQRKNLNAIEEARTYQKILELDEMTQEELAKTMGKSQSAVANKVRLLSLPEEVQEAVLKENISERHARALLNVPDADKQKELLNQVIEERMPVRKLEKTIKELYPKEKSVGEIVNVEDQEIQKPDSEKEASSNDFVNNDPLKPAADINEEDSESGKIVVAPPEGSEDEGSKFINFGEIDDDEDSDEPDIQPAELPETKTTADINEIKSSATDINLNTDKKKENKSDLDNLLNISSDNNTTKEEQGEFITPAESIVKTDEQKESDESGDYFKTPDLVSIDLPTEPSIEEDAVPTEDSEETDEEKPSEVETETPTEEKQQPVEIDTVDGKYTIQTAVEKARHLVQELNEHDLPTDIEEMNFNKSYQIIIKIEKQDEE